MELQEGNILILSGHQEAFKVIFLDNSGKEIVDCEEIPRLFSRSVEDGYRAKEMKLKNPDGTLKFPTNDEILICRKDKVFYNHFTNTLTLGGICRIMMAAYQGALRDENRQIVEPYLCLGVIAIIQDISTGNVILALRKNSPKEHFVVAGYFSCKERSGRIQGLIKQNFWTEITEELFSNKDGKFKLFQERSGKLEEVYPNQAAIEKLRCEMRGPHSICLDGSHIHFMTTVKTRYLQTLWNAASSGDVLDPEHTGNTVVMLENGAIIEEGRYDLAQNTIAPVLQADAAGSRLPNVISAATEHSQSFIDRRLCSGEASAKSQSLIRYVSNQTFVDKFKEMSETKSFCEQVQRNKEKELLAARVLQ